MIAAPGSGADRTMDPRIETSLANAIKTLDFRDLLERASPALGLPGPRPRMEVAREMAIAIARERGRGRELAKKLAESEREDARLLAAAAFAAFLAHGAKRTELLADLQVLGEDVRGTVRAGV